MAISIDPLTHIIFVPRADLTLVQASPEVRELDLNAFRLELKSIEADPDLGIFLLKTHLHNTEVTLSGLTYARIIEVIDPYTVEFEDGQYTINCVGANHNLADVKVANQVSLIVNNAAGLINNAQIEYASFNGGVTVDEANGVPGTLFPIGTPSQPVNNWPDALLIASFRGFPRFYVDGDADLDGSFNLTDYVIIGESPSKTLITIEGLATTTGLEIKNATVTGILDGENFISDSTCMDLEYVNGRLFNCGLIGDIELSGGADAVLNDCYTIDQDNPPVLDMGGTGQTLVMPNYSGLITIKNLSDPTQEVGIGVDAGKVVLDSTITAGMIIVSGIGTIEDNSQGAAIVDSSSLVSNHSIADAVWAHISGQLLVDMESGRWKLENNQMIFYKADNLTEITRFNLFDAGGLPAMENVYERQRDTSNDTAWKFPQYMHINVGSLESGVLTDLQSDNGDRLQMNEVTGDGFDYVFVFEGIEADELRIDINGYYAGNPAHNVKIKILNINSYQWVDLTVDAKDFPSDSSDQDYSFDLPSPLDDYATHGTINIKIEHESQGTPGHYLYLDKMELTVP